MFAYLIPKLLCNITRVWMSAPKKVLLWNELKHSFELKHRLDRERPHFESARQENYLQLSAQMFAYLIPKLLCNITRVWMSAPKKVLLWNELKHSFELKHRLDRERPHFESARQEIIFNSFILIFPSDFSLVIPFGHFSAWLVHIRRSSCWQAYLLKLNFNVIASFKLSKQVSFLK